MIKTGKVLLQQIRHLQKKMMDPVILGASGKFKTKILKKLWCFSAF